MKILALDISMKCSGWAIFEDENLITSGAIQEQRYKGDSKERYPQRTLRVGKLMSHKLIELVTLHNPDYIVVEEVIQQGSAGIKSIKGLIQVHGMLFYQMTDEQLNKVKLYKPSEWRKIIGLKMNGDWKRSAVDRVNRDFGLNLKLEDNDQADAILQGYSFVLRLQSGNLEE